MADFDISALISADSATFVRAMESTSRSIRNVLKSIDPTTAAIDKMNDQVRILENGLRAGRLSQDAFASATARIKAQTEATVTALNRTQQASGASRAGMQQLSFQIGDVATQFASGTGAMQIFAQQSTQIVQAIALMRGSTGGFIGFLAGPWGAVLTSAAIVAVPLIDRILGIGDAASESKTEVDALSRAIASLRAGRGAVTSEALGAAQVRLRQLEGQLRDKSIAPGAGGTRGDQIANAARRKQIEAEIADTKAVIAGAEGRLAAQNKLDALERQGQTTRKSDRGSGGGEASAKAARAAAEAQREQTKAFDDAIKRQADYVKGIEQDKQSLIDLYDKPLKDAQDLSATLEKIDRLQKLGQIGDGTALKYKAAASLGPMDEQIGDLSKALDAFVSKNSDVTAKAATDWEAASRDILSSLQSLKGGIQSGDFLDILSGALDIFTSLGKLGAFGGGVQSAFGGARAAGGPVSAGTSYLVGERGPELFTPSASGRIIANDNLSRMQAGGSIGSATVRIVPSEYFKAVVQGEAASVAAPMATRGAVAGSALAQQSIARRQRNRIPG